MSARLKSPQWKRRMLALVADRDGLSCLVCGAGQSFKYIDAGRNQTDEGHSFCWTYRRSFLELDHHTPLKLGGTNDPYNLQLLCHDCHKAKTSREQSIRLKSLFAETLA